MGLLSLEDEPEVLGEGSAFGELRNAVIFSADFLKRYNETVIPQYGLLGSLAPDNETGSSQAADRMIFLNTNIPFSAFVCGVQGSGKSHTTACMLGERYSLTRSWDLLGNI